MHEKRFKIDFSKFSKTSEKVVFYGKSLGECLGKYSRCRYYRRKKNQIDKHNFFTSEKVVSNCRSFYCCVHSQRKWFRRHVANIGQNRFYIEDFHENSSPSCFYVSFFGKKNLANFNHFFDQICYQNHWEPPYGRYRGEPLRYCTKTSKISIIHALRKCAYFTNLIS